MCTVFWVGRQGIYCVLGWKIECVMCSGLEDRVCNVFQVGGQVYIMFWVEKHSIYSVLISGTGAVMCACLYAGFNSKVFYYFAIIKCLIFYNLSLFKSTIYSFPSCDNDCITLF